MVQPGECQYFFCRTMILFHNFPLSTVHWGLFGLTAVPIKNIVCKDRFPIMKKGQESRFSVLSCPFYFLLFLIFVGVWQSLADRGNWHTAAWYCLEAAPGCDVFDWLPFADYLVGGKAFIGVTNGNPDYKTLIFWDSQYFPGSHGKRAWHLCC